MGYQKLQVGRATEMANLLSDSEDTVNLNDVILTGTTAAGTTGTTVVSAANTFIGTDGKNKVNVGDLVVNTSSTPKASRITAVVSDTTVTVQTTGLFGTSDNFNVLSKSTEPAVLFVGTVGASPTLKVRTMGGDDITLNNVVQGTFLPIQVKRVYNTGTSNVSDIIALF